MSFCSNHHHPRRDHAGRHCAELVTESPFFGGSHLRPGNSQAQLAGRWQVAEASLERWRFTGIGPRVLKLLGDVRYRLDDVEAFEEACLKNATRAPTSVWQEPCAVGAGDIREADHPQAM